MSDIILPDWLFAEDYGKVCSGATHRMCVYDMRWHCEVDESVYCSHRYISKRNNQGNDKFCGMPVFSDEIRIQREKEGKEFGNH